MSCYLFPTGSFVQLVLSILKSTNRMAFLNYSLETVVSTMLVVLPGRLSLIGIGTFQVKTHSSSTLLLTRPNFLRVPLSFTPPWIFNYTDKELGKHLSPCFSLSLSMLDSQVEIPHLSNMGAAPVTVHLITLGPVLSPDATQCHAARTSCTHTHRKLK